MTPRQSTPLGWVRASLLSVCLGSTGALASHLVIEVNNHPLLPNTPGQKIEIEVRGGIGVAGLNLRVQVGDGFSEVPGSVLDGPNITGVDIIGTERPTIFTANNTGQQDPGSGAQMALRSTTTTNGNVAAEGLLVTLTIDTTGIAGGTFPLLLAGTFAGPTELLDAEGEVVPAQITDGMLTIVGGGSQPSLPGWLSHGDQTPGQLQLKTITVQGNGKVVIAWTAVPGLPYRVSRKDRLDQSEWTPLAELRALGSLGSFEDDVTDVATRFYRVELGAGP